MAIFSARTLVLNRVCVLWSVAFFLIKNPQALYGNALVVMLAAGPNLDQVYPENAGIFPPLLAVFMFLSGVEDLVLLSFSNLVEILHVLVPIRLCVYFALCVLAYTKVLGFGNSIALAYGFIEMMINFWIYLSVREEDNEDNRRRIRQARGYEEN